MTLARALAGRTLTPTDLSADGNAFTALRWLLATSVMFSHGWDLTTGRAGLDPSVAVLGLPVSGLAVLLFFTLSGFLVTGSLAKRGVAEFAVARALRLVPGLWAMLLLVTFGLGAWLTTLPLDRYLADPQTWRFLARNASLLTAEYRLPGVFETLPIAGVNGSLWTIPQEVRCYVALALLGAVGALRSRRWLAAVLCAVIVVQLVVPLDLWPMLDRPRRLGLSFLLGVVAYQWRGSLRWSVPAAVAAVAVLLALVQAGLPRPVLLVAEQTVFAYATGVVAFCGPGWLKAASRRLPDFSYGIYIYAFPAQQVAIALNWGTTPLTNIAVGFALMLPVAAASWYLIERPALELKPRLLSRRVVKVSENLTIDGVNASSIREKSRS